MSWSLVQSASANPTGPVTSMTVAFTSSVTVGNLVVVKVASFYAATSVTDSGSNTWTQGVGNSGSNASIWYSHVTTGGVLTITVASSNAGGFYPAVEIQEWAGGSSSTVDGSALATGSSATPSPGSITTTGASDLVVSVAALSASYGTVSPAAGFTLTYTNAYVSGSEGAANEYAANVAAGTYTPAFTITTPVSWTAAALAFAMPPPPTVASIGPQTEVVTYSEPIATLPSATLVATNGSGSIAVTVSSINSTQIQLAFATVPTTGQTYTLTLTGGTATDGSALQSYTTTFVAGLPSVRNRWIPALVRRAYRPRLGA